MNDIHLRLNWYLTLVGVRHLNLYIYLITFDVHSGAAEPHVQHVRRHRASIFAENCRASKF
jgi:hypothetical protein